MLRIIFLCLAVAACGGKIDPGGDGGEGNDASSGGDASTTKDAQPTIDVISPPAKCSPISGGSTVGSDGSCTSTASWTCGSTKYDVQCSCPSAQCTCSQETNGMGAGTMVKAPSFCPGCSSNLPALCNFPTN